LPIGYYLLIIELLVSLDLLGDLFQQRLEFFKIFLACQWSTFQTLSFPNRLQLYFPSFQYSIFPFSFGWCQFQSGLDPQTLQIFLACAAAGYADARIADFCCFEQSEEGKKSRGIPFPAQKW
jgi:hypothetical protein